MPEGLLASQLSETLGAHVSKHLTVGTPLAEGPREYSNGPSSPRGPAVASLLHGCGDRLRCLGEDMLANGEDYLKAP